MNRIKQLREENKITQIQLAQKLNKTQQTISLYENGTNEPDLDSYILLSSIFNCSIEYIAGKSDIRNQYKLNIDDEDIAFASSVKPLNETNKMIIKNTIEALLTKQEKDEEDK